MGPLKKVLLISFLWMVGCASTPPRLTPKQVNLPSNLMWPLARRNVSQPFREPAAFRDRHDGIDIPAPRGTRIYAASSGRVVYAGSKFNGYGKLIIVEHNDKLSTFYAHCHKLLVKAGDQVRKGSLIGLVGATGRASAPHLHFEVRYALKPINPMSLLQ